MQCGCYLKALKGSAEFDEDGSFLTGVWEHGVKQGQFKIETTRNGVCFIDAEYRNNKVKHRWA